MTTTKKMIDFELERLKENTGLNLQIDHNPVYGGYVLEELEKSNGGVREVSYYRMQKQAFYTMLHAMNKVFERKKEITA